MNTILKVIAFELGVLIAIFTWTAFSNSSNQKKQVAQAAEEPVENTFATLSPDYQPSRAAVPAVDYLADDQPAELADNEPIETLQTYQPAVAAEQPYDYAGDNYGYAPGYDYGYDDPSNYIGTYPEPVLGPDYYYGCPYGGFISSVPAQVVIIRSPRFSNHRFTGMRHGAQPRMRTAPPRPRMHAAPPRAGNSIARRSPGVRGGPVASHRTTGARSSRPATAAVRTAWHR